MIRGEPKVKGYSPQSFVMKPDTGKLKKLGFEARVSVQGGFARVMEYYKHNESSL